MVNYKIIKFCRMCKARFVVEKGHSKRIYCDPCELKPKNYVSDTEERK